MEDMEIVDRRGFSWLRIGDDRETVRARLGTFRTFRRGQGTVLESSFETDQFAGPPLVMVTYDSSDRASLIEVVHPAPVRLSGVQLLDRVLADVTAELVEAGLRVVQDDVGVSVDE